MVQATRIGNRATIAATAVIHRKKNLRLGRRVTIMDFAVLGLPNYYQDIFTHDRHKLIRIGDHCRIYPWALIYEGATLEASVVMEERTTVGSLTTVGANTRIVYQAQVNDKVVIGKDCVIGGFVADNCKIGRGCSVFGALVHRYQNHNTVAWDTTDEPGPVLEDGVVVGWGAVIVGGVRIGARAHILPNVLVTEDVPAGVKYGVRNGRNQKP